MIFALREGIFVVILGEYVMILSTYTLFGGFLGLLGAFWGTSDPSLAAVGLPVVSVRSHDHIPFYFFFAQQKK